jgi:hypothetical protein
LIWCIGTFLSALKYGSFLTLFPLRRPAWREKIPPKWRRPWRHVQVLYRQLLFIFIKNSVFRFFVAASKC